MSEVPICLCASRVVHELECKVDLSRWRSRSMLRRRAFEFVHRVNINIPRSDCFVMVILTPVKRKWQIRRVSP